nr:DNA-directed DNA polymerase [Tanacetum cinerariifolium]
MHTRSQSRNTFPQQECSPAIVEPLHIELPFLEDQFQEDTPEVPMADNRTMAELLQAPTEGYEDAIVILEIFFPHSKTTNIRNEITRFQQRFDESFYEAWDRFNDLLRACPHHGFSELHQLDTFYNALNVNDQDSLNSAAGGNFLDKMPRECLKIIESKSKVHQSRAKAVVAKVSTSSSTLSISSEVAKLKDIVRALLLDKKINPQLQLILLLLLQLKQLSQIMLLAVVLTRTKIVPLPTETFIETTSNSMYHKSTQQITTKETPVSDLRWLQIKFDLPVFLSFKPIKIIKTISIGGTISIKTEVVNQPPAYQAPAYQAHIPQTQSVSRTDFESYVKANDAVLRNMQNQGQNMQNQCQSLQIQMANLTNMLCKFVSSNTASSSGSRTLPNNTITNPKEDLKGISTRSGVAYQGPTIPTSSKVMKQGTEVTKDQVKIPSSQSTAPVHPLVVQSKTQTAESPLLLPKLGDPGKFLIPCEFPGMDECLALADHGASINLMPLSVWEGLSLSELTPTCMTLKLADRSVSKPIGIAKDVLVKVGVFHFPADFMVVDFKPDPRVPLILERCFLKTDRALIDVHKGELTLRIRNKAITYNLDQTSRYSANYNQMTANKINVIDMACEDEPLPPLPNHEQYMPSFNKELKVCEAKTVKSFVDEPPEVELKDLPPLPEYAFLEGDNRLPVIIAKELGDEEKSALIKVLNSHKRAITWKLSDIHEVEKLLDAGLIYPISDSPWVSLVHYVPKKGGFTVVKNEENELIPTRLVTGWRSYFMVKEGIVLGHKISKNGIEVDKAKVDVIAKLPHPTTVKGVRSFLGHAGAVLGQCHEKHFRPIHYASKMMTDAESNYTTTEKEMLAVVYAFEKFWSYLIMNKSIVHTDHSALKYLFAKKDAKARLLRWVLLLQEFDFKFRDTKGAKNLAADQALDILEACHNGPTRGHHGANLTAKKQANFDLAVAGDHRKVQLNELNELRDHAYENSLIYKEKTKRIHDFKIKNRVFNVGDRVLLFNSRLKIFSGKLKTRWSEPFTITKFFPYGTVELSQANGPNFKVNGHRVKHYFGGDIPQLVVPDLQTFPMDQ